MGDKIKDKDGNGAARFKVSAWLAVVQKQNGVTPPNADGCCESAAAEAPFGSPRAPPDIGLSSRSGTSPRASTRRAKRTSKEGSSPEASTRKSNKEHSSPKGTPKGSSKGKASPQATPKGKGKASAASATAAAEPTSSEKASPDAPAAAVNGASEDGAAAADASTAAAGAPGLAPASAPAGAPASETKSTVAALLKQPNQKTYLPRFGAPEAYGKRKGASDFSQIKKDVEERMARKAAAEERARQRANRKPIVIEIDEGMDDEEKEAWISLLVTTAVGILLALIEAIDIEILLGFLAMPFVAAMKWLAEVFDNKALDPTLWTGKISSGYGHFAENHPLGFVMLDFGTFAVCVVLILFWDDLERWWATRHLRAQGYDELKDGEVDDEISQNRHEPDALRVLLRQVREDLEEHDLKMHLKEEDAEESYLKEMRLDRAKHEDKVARINGYLSLVETEGEGAGEESMDLEAMARERAKAEAKKKREGGCADITKMAVGILKNTIAGAIAVWLYFMDLITDIQVTLLFYDAGALLFAIISGGLVIGQFTVVWIRVLPYLKETYGGDSVEFKAFLFGGMPLGMFMLDFLMFLGPFGLLPYAPLPEKLRLFVPAYAATRNIAEVLVEALPQCVLQACILVLVSTRVRGGTASAVDTALYTSKGGTFVTLMPKSILISSATMIKTWYEIVQEAREAGVSVAKKALQLWQVGSGLPLDAIKKGSIQEWKCQYEISDNEVLSLVDALMKNEGTIEHLDLALAGFEWMVPAKHEERSAVNTLLAELNKNPKCLPDLQKLVVSKTTAWEIPIGALRAGTDQAIKALGEAPFLSKGGPEREEMSTMFELLCKNRGETPDERSLELSTSAVTKIFQASQKGSNIKARRTAWQAGVAQLMVKGMTRRAHFKVVVGAEVLHNVGFGVTELLELEFSPTELKQGGVEASELRAAGFGAPELKGLGYSPKEMFEAEIPASEMKALSYNATELHKGGYTALQLKEAQYTLAELKDAKYKAAELGGSAGFHIPQLREAKFSALDLRKAQIFTVQMMRDAGYTAVEMKKAGYDAKRVHEAGYDAREATDAEFTLSQMHAAGYSAAALRKGAGFTAPVLREVGYDLNDLQGAGFIASELEEAGYTAQELKEAGTSLVQLKAAGTPVAKLKDVGYTASRLKQQGYTAAELALGARGRVDLTTSQFVEKLSGKEPSEQSLRPQPDEGGYTAKELRAGGITANELKRGRVFFHIDEFRDGGWPTPELRSAGYAAGELRACGYSAPELSKAGYSIQDLLVAKFPATELRAVGATASELKGLGLSARELAEVGYNAKELLVAGFTATELIACGFGVGELREAGFTAPQLRELGFTARELKEYGYGAGALKETGSVVRELKELGFPDSELEEAGFTKRAVEAVDGRSVRELKESDACYLVSELREYGFEVPDFRCIYTVKEMNEQGCSLEDLLAGGLPEHAVRAVDGRPINELRKAGYTAKVLKKVGYSLTELVDGDFTASELKEAGSDAEELKVRGFTAGDLRVAGFTLKEVHEANYTLEEMREGGYFWKELVIFLRSTHAELKAAGFRTLDKWHRLFMEYKPLPDESLIDDYSVLSPRYKISMMSPRGGAVTDRSMGAVTERSMGTYEC